jgi:hypothetical protein
MQRRNGSHGILSLLRPGPGWLVAAALGYGLLNLRSLLLPVPYQNDSAVHEQMVRFATSQFRAGHVPLTAWYPYLGEGSPQFLHYQSLPAMLTGLAGLVLGPDVAFRWSLYLLLCLWPLSIFAAARLFDIAPWPAAAAAAISPFIISVPGIGYEQHAYVWLGYGVWTQLWAATTLPLAWGLSWRALDRGQGYLAALAMTALTVAFHFETGYLALFPLLLWPFISRPKWPVRLCRAAFLLSCSFVLSAWVFVPVIVQSRFAAVNEALRGSPLANGYGAEKVLDWLVTGRMLDDGRLPVLTLFAAVGVAEALLRFRRDATARALLVLLAGSLLLSFGRTTFGVLTDVVPGATDIFFRRFMMGSQLALILLAGRGASRLGVAAWSGCLWWYEQATADVLSRSRAVPPPYLKFAALLLVLAPAWLQLNAFDHKNARAIAAQRRADRTAGRQLAPLIKRIRAGGGRVYAGMPENWGSDLRVGAVPVYKYLAAEDVDEVGYTLRTASLMTGPESHYQAWNPSDYRLFAVRYILLPAGKGSPVPARLLGRSGPYALWRTRASNGYISLGTITGAIDANRTNLGARTFGVLEGRSAEHDRYVKIEFARGGAGAAAETPSSSRPMSRPPVGSVHTAGSPLRGRVVASVQMRHPGVVVLSASFDPGWHVTVDGRACSTLMVAPALTAVHVGAGPHVVIFSYRSFRYGRLLLLGMSAFFLLLVFSLKSRWSNREPRTVLPHSG